MNAIVKSAKYILHTSIPGFLGWFSYYGTRVYFPDRSHIFKLACEQGIYESRTLHFVSNFVKPESIYVDVGANIGLLSIPILYDHPSVKVISIEPSPNSAPYLIRTIKGSKYSDRWQYLDKALSNNIGELPFFASSPELGAFDGLRDTHRTDQIKEVLIQSTTLDHEWARLEKPSISCIKIDVEGAELKVLEGATDCIRTEKPTIILEWNQTNLATYDYKNVSLLEWANEFNYKLYSLPYVIPVKSPEDLKLQMLVTENFLLLSIDNPNFKIM